MASKAMTKEDDKQLATRPGGAMTTPAPQFIPSHDGPARGVSTRSEDVATPLIYVLQALSPQVDQKNPAYVAGAKTGDIWLRNVMAVDGEKGVRFQPCHFKYDFVEWVPRSKGGGIAGRHLVKSMEDIPGVEKKPDPQNANKMIWMLPNGNEVKETKYHAGYVLLDDRPPLAFVIPLSSTGLQVSKEWVFNFYQRMLSNGKMADSFASYYLLKTKQRKNAAGVWYVLDPQLEGWVESEEAFKRGLALYELFEAGMAKVEELDQNVEEVAKKNPDEM